MADTGFGFDLNDGDWTRVRQLFQLIGSSLRLGPTSVPRFAGLAMAGNILPVIDNTYDIGETSTPLRWKDICCAGGGRFDGGVSVGTVPGGTSLPISIQVNLAGETAIGLVNQGAGDSQIYLFAGSAWSIGIDNSDSDKLKISQHADIGTNDRFTMTTAGDIASGAYNGVIIFGGVGNLELSSNAAANYWESAGYNGIQGQADGFLLYGGTVSRNLTVTGGDWTLDQSVASGATPTFGADNFSDGGSNAIVTTTQETNWDNHLSNDGTDHSLLGATAGTVSASLAVIVDANKDIDFDGGDIFTTGQMALGAAISATDWLKILTPKHALNTTGSRWAFAAVARAQATANTANSLGGFVGGSQTFGTYNYTGTIYGLQGQIEHVGTGAITNASGLIGKVENFNGIAGTITAAKVIKATLDAEDGTVDAGYMFAAEAAAVDNGTLTTVYSFYDAGQTNAGTNWGLGINTQSYINANLSIGKNTAPTAALSMGNDALIAADVNSGLTASTTQSQGQGALTAQVNEISTVANKDDTVTLPSAVTGIMIEIINNGANTLQIFPASGDDLGLGVNAAEELEANERVGFVAYDTTNWAKEFSTEIIHAEIHDEDNTDAFVINDAGGDFHSYHTNGLAAGDLADWTFDAGGAGTSHAITGIAQAGSDITVTTGDAHELEVGDIVSQTNLADAAYVGVFDVLTVPTTTTYTVTATYTATGTGTMDQAATLEANAVAAGVYSFAYCISGTSSTNNETVDFQLHKEATAVVGSKVRRKFGTASDFGAMSGCGVVTVASGDKISLALSNEDSAGNITLRNFTLVLIRL